jgi:hypothetical protein
MEKIYKTLTLTAIIFAFFSLNSYAQNAWINEIHYDDYGTDTLEFIEVVIQDVENYSLSSFAVVLYNGNNGKAYDTTTVDLYTEGTTENIYTFYYFFYPVNGVQNGSPDGLVFLYNDEVIPGQFLSYEGVVTAVDGPAIGLTSVDIGVLEEGGIEGLSLQLSGESTEYDGFTWQAPAAETHGQLNNDQTLLHFGVGEPGLAITGIYPNPNPGSFRVINPSNKNITATIYSIGGQLTNEFTVIPGENVLKTGNISNGTYIIRFTTQEGKLLNSERIIIK